MTDSTRSFDYLLVGQGLAGTLLAHFLIRKGQRVGIIDEARSDAASRVAAGIINPITGRRYVKSWRVDELIPFAEETYRALEAELGIHIYHPRHILRALFNQGEENDWLARSGEAGYQSYILDQADLEAYASCTQPAYGYGEVRQAAQVDIGDLVIAYRKRLLAEGCLLAEQFDHQKLELPAGLVRYGSWQADRLVFCEGHRATANPFFNYLPFGGAKGEVLLVRIPGADFEKILKHRVFIVPLSNGLYWVGATYDWNFKDSAPTEKGGQFLRERLEDILTVPFEIVARQAAVRPTVRDRRPFLGRHPEFGRLFIFNGLGTKGASLGPFWADQMAAYLTEDQPLDPAVHIERFGN